MGHADTLRGGAARAFNTGEDELGEAALAGALALDAIAAEKAWRAHESACGQCRPLGSMNLACGEGGNLARAAQDAMRKAMEADDAR